MLILIGGVLEGGVHHSSLNLQSRNTKKTFWQVKITVDWLEFERVQQLPITAHQ
jgi:hypothetical protein